MNKLEKNHSIRLLRILSFILNTINNKAIKAIVAVAYIMIDTNDLLKKDSLFNALIMKALATKIGYNAPRNSFQQTYPIEDNFLRLKKFFPELTNIISKQDIANYLGITLRSLNRTINNLKERGLLNS